MHPTEDGKPKKKKTKTKKMVGENTGPIRKDSKGKDYSLIQESTKDLAKGDTIRNIKSSQRTHDYIMGGDYGVQKTGKKSYKIKK